MGLARKLRFVPAEIYLIVPSVPAQASGEPRRRYRRISEPAPIIERFGENATIVGLVIVRSQSGEIETKCFTSIKDIVKGVPASDDHALGTPEVRQPARAPIRRPSMMHGEGRFKPNPEISGGLAPSSGESAC